MTDKTSDTPETDALMHILSGIELNMPSLLEHARSLERRLAAAEKDNQVLKNTLTNITMGRFVIEDTVNGKNLTAWDS